MSEIQIETSKAILNNDDLELIIMYLESKKRSKCGFNIRDYDLIDKYNIRIEYQNFEDKLTLLKYIEFGYLDDLSIKNFNLTFSLPLTESILIQELNCKKNNQLIILYNLQDKLKYNREYLEQFVDAITSDVDGCEHSSIEISKIFDSCIYVRYNIEFDKDLVLNKFKNHANLNRNCELLLAYQDLSYLLLRIKKTQININVIDSLKKKFNFKSCRSIDNYLLLEFKNLADLKDFKKENSIEYDIEVVHNLELLNLSQLKQTDDDNLTEYKEFEIVIQDHFNLKYFSLDNDFLKILENRVSELYNVDSVKCNFAEDNLVINFKSNTKEDVYELVHDFLNKEIKAAKITFNFSKIISSKEDKICKTYLNELQTIEKIYFNSCNLKNGLIEIYGLKDHFSSFVEKINKMGKYFVKENELSKIRVLFTDKNWFRLKEAFESLPNCIIKAKPKELCIEFNGKYIDCLFCIIYSKAVIENVRKQLLNLTKAQINFLKAREESIIKNFKAKSLFIILDFHDQDNLYLHSINGNNIQSAIDELNHLLLTNKM